jgi:hypothetical protein
MVNGGDAGVAIDFYLKAAAAGPVTLEIFDSAGASLRTYSTDPAAERDAGIGPQGGRGRGGARGGLPAVSPLWQKTPEPFSAEPGMHRIVWNPVQAPKARGRGGPGGTDGAGAGAAGGTGGAGGARNGNAGGGGGGRGRGEQIPLIGTFTAKLTADSRTLAQSFTVKPDPRENEE